MVYSLKLLENITIPLLRRYDRRVTSDHPAAPQAPAGVDISKPAAARVYDWLLGGDHNFAMDREFGQRMVETMPIARLIALENRAFLRRAVTWMLEHGITQFLDIGSGVPTAGNVHEIAQARNPHVRTVYVDYEQVAVSHARLILDQQDPDRRLTDVLQADFRDPAAILGSRQVASLLDFTKPVGLLLVALLPFIGPGDDPAGLLAQYREPLPPGSALAMTQGTSEGLPEDMVEPAKRILAGYGNTANPVFSRTPEEFTALFTGFDLVDPGVVPAPLWYPDGPSIADPAKVTLLAGVAIKK